jgi:hypothetical protein
MKFALFVLASLCLFSVALSQTGGGYFVFPRGVGADGDFTQNITVTASYGVSQNGTGVNTTNADVSGYITKTITFLQATGPFPPDHVNVIPDNAVNASSITYEIVYSNNQTNRIEIYANSTDVTVQKDFFLGQVKDANSTVVTIFTSGDIDAIVLGYNTSAVVITSPTPAPTFAPTFAPNTTSSSSAPSTPAVSLSLSWVAVIACLVLAAF